MNHPRVSIIVLNWNGGEDTIECLESLFQITYPNYEVIVVDNNSEDDSVSLIKRWASGQLKVSSKYFKYNKGNKPIKFYEYLKQDLSSKSYLKLKASLDKLPSNKKLFILKNDKNYGYAEGNNIAIRQVLSENQSDYLLLLNNDTVVDNLFLYELVKYAEENMEIGIVGPKIYHYNYSSKDNVIQTNGSILNLYTGTTYEIDKNIIENSKNNKRENLNYIWGTSMLVKVELIKKIGLLKKGYFMYIEDAEYCYRAKKYSFQTYCVPSSIIWHKLENSSKKISGFTIYYRTRNIFWFEKEYANFFQYFVFIMYYFIFVFSKFTLGCIIKKKDFPLLKKYLLAVKEGLLYRV